MKNIYELARHCKCISDEKMGTDKTLIPYRNIMFTDYTVKGAIDEYLIAMHCYYPKVSATEFCAETT